MECLNRYLYKIIEKKLYFKYRNVIYGNQKLINQLTTIFILKFEKRYVFHIKLYNNYFFSVHSISWNEEDIFEKMTIGVYQKLNNEFKNLIYLKNGFKRNKKSISG